MSSDTDIAVRVLHEGGRLYQNSHNYGVRLIDRAGSRHVPFTTSTVRELLRLGLIRKVYGGTGIRWRAELTDEGQQYAARLASRARL